VLWHVISDFPIITAYTILQSPTSGAHTHGYDNRGVFLLESVFGCQKRRYIMHLLPPNTRAYNSLNLIQYCDPTIAIQKKKPTYQTLVDTFEEVGWHVTLTNLTLGS
jgi:hypothetical protein